ncbi:MAG: GyrI-like domain-containing protein [Enhydrobacter sp.]|nr:GyrI-like domain-containing protein [Enhydrobacter sp.]
MTCSIVTTERRLTAVIRAKVPFAGIPDAQRSARSTLAATLPSLDAGVVGPGITRFRTPADGVLDMEMGSIVARRFDDRGDVVLSELPAGRAAYHSMKGSFAGLPGAWQTLFEWCARQGMTPGGLNWEIYGAQQDADLYVLLA